MDSYIWRAAAYSTEAAQRIAAELDLPLLVGIVLARRGITDPEQARRFLEVDGRVPDPFAFADMGQAVALLEEALSKGRRVVVHGDYDADGITATALLIRGLAALGLQAEGFLPSRFREGYGLSRQSVEHIAGGGEALLITVDCGVAYPEEVRLAGELGLSVIVTDHHRPGTEMPPGPVIHPSVGEYPGDHLAGVGIALKLLHGLYVHRGRAAPDRLPPELEEHLDLVALGTVADLVPLVGENRYYVREGLVRLGMSQKVGLTRLVQVSGSAGRLSAETLGFRLGPRLNAAGRISDAEKPLRLLLTDDDAEAERLAAELDEMNRQRQEVERRIFQEALEEVEALAELPRALVLAGEGWHEGVVGIVASRLVERFHRPTILLSVSGDTARGSGRSIPAFDLVAGLRACDSLLLQYGGHRQAAGLTLDRADIPAFREAFLAQVEEHLTEEDLLKSFAPDAVVRGKELTLEVAEALERLAPFGQGNPPVRLLALAGTLSDPALTRTGEHLRCTLEVDGVGAKGIGFRFGHVLPEIQEDPVCHAGLFLEVAEWQGYTRPEVRLHSLYRPKALGEESLGCAPACPFRDDLSAAAPCESCADPFGSANRAYPLEGNDLRGSGGYLSYIAQILSSGEPASVVGMTVSQRLPVLTSHLPLIELGVRGVDCVSRACWRTRLDELRPEALLFVDWTAAERRASLLLEKRHVFVLDPPYRAGQTVLLRELRRKGLQVHLLYGDEERRYTERALKLLEHPRPWMVELYRAYERGLRDVEAWERTIEAVHERYGVLGSAEEVGRAADILKTAGHGGSGAVEATISVEEVAAYAAAVGRLEEALRLCRTH